MILTAHSPQYIQNNQIQYISELLQTFVTFQRKMLLQTVSTLFVPVTSAEYLNDYF